MLEGVNPGGREVPALPHRSAERVLEAPGALDELPRSREDGADAAAKAFAQVNPDGIERSGVLLRRNSHGDLRVEQPGAVHVRLHAAIVGDLADGAKLLEGPDRAVAEVVRLLDTQQAWHRAVSKERPKRVVDLLWRENALSPVDRLSRDPAQQGRPAEFPSMHVRHPIE